MQITENFTREEFDSKDGTHYPKEWIKIRLKALCEQLEIIRAVVGAPLHILSGFRTPEHNKKIGGKPKSKHMEGIAVDFVCKHMATNKLSFLIEKLIKSGELSNGGLGVYKTFIHYDLRVVPARWYG